MKTFTNKSITKKISIVLILVILLSFGIPKPVKADWGGMLMSPLISLVTGLFDGVQYLLEWAMLGRPNYFMEQTKDDFTDEYDANTNYYQKEVDQEIDGSFMGFDDPNIPDIQYTPEAIFSNRVPALDINFISPSVTSGNADDDTLVNRRNVALQLQPMISSWYVAIRTLAIVGLLSVLVYLGIRMMLTSIAADRAKYKKMLMDWVIAMCLLFGLHYIMSLALTASEVLTSVLSNSIGQKIELVVNSWDGFTFHPTFMNYIRFMVQSEDLSDKLVYCVLYGMLVICTARFTWMYLKRVVNMAFLTLIAPFVALSYPIDKVSDGSAQAFNMWIKEYSFNAVIQPLHLLLYTVLLGGAIELATDNPLYAIVCFAFMVSGEKLLKQMFGFNKASGGTIGSIAGTAGISALTHQALTSMGKKLGSGGGNGSGGQGKVRTSNQYERQGKNSNLNKSEFDSFNTNAPIGVPTHTSTSGQNTNEASQGTNREEQKKPDRFTADDKKELDELNEWYNNADYNDAFMPDTSAEWAEKQSRMDELEKKREAYYGDLSNDERSEFEQLGNEIRGGLDPDSEEYKQKLARYNELSSKRFATEDETDADTDADESVQTELDTTGSPNPGMTQEALYNLGSDSGMQSARPNTFTGMFGSDVRRVGRGVANRAGSVGRGVKALGNRDTYRNLGKKVITGVKGAPHALNVAAGAGYRAAKAAAPVVAYKAARGTLRTATRLAGAATLGIAGLAIGAMTGDAEKAVSMTAGAMGAGIAGGTGVFERTTGKVMKDKSVREAVGSAKYGSAVDYRNAKADAAFLKSKEFNEYYEKNFKGKKTKQEVKQAFKSYREAGITDNNTIKKAIQLEDKYLTNGGDKQAVRENVQGIIQTKDMVDSRSYRDDKFKQAEIARLERQLTNVTDPKLRRQRAETLFQGYRDFYEIG